MKKLFIIFLLFTSMCLWAQNVPQTIDYQGRLADSDGNYLNVLVTVNFLIYNVETGGAALWSETQDVSCANGVFHVQLGSVTPLPGTLFDIVAPWLELVVGGETLAPRTAIASVPYSLKTEDSYYLNGFSSSDFMLSTTDNWVNTTGDTMTGPLSVLNDVGIGTTSPFSKFQIEDNTPDDLTLSIHNINTAGSERLYFGQSSNEAGIVVWGSTNSSNPGKWRFFNNKTSANYDWVTSGSISMTLTNDGYLGIGTTTPTTKLDVVGNFGYPNSVIKGENGAYGNAGAGVRGTHTVSGNYGFLGDWLNGVCGYASSYYAGYFSGNVTVTGTFSNPSDERFKENVQPFTQALSKIKLMNVHTFNFKQMAEEKQLVLPEGKQIGLIAQELEEILPELVVDNIHAYDRNKGIEGTESDMEQIEYKGINYIGLIPVLIEAIKELNTQNEKHQQQIEKQQKQIEELQQQNAEL